MSKLYEILNELKSTSSRLEKEAILQANKDNALLESVLIGAYNQIWNYGVLAFPETPPGPYTFEELKSEINYLLNDLKTRELTGHAAIGELVDIAAKLDAPGQEILRGIINKDLKIGAQLKTLQKVWDSPFFEEFKVMLCQDFDKFQHKLKWPCIAQTKFDASRVIVIVDGNPVQYKTRNGRDYVINDDDLDEIFLKMRDLYGRDCIFDGELYQLEHATLKPKSRQVSNGVATKLVRGTASLSEQQSVGITIWDIVELQPFLADSCQVEYHDRYDTLLKLIIQNPNQRVQIATNFIVDNPEQAMELSDKMIKDGEEGIIIKSPENLYRRKRGNDILKIKEVQELDLKCVGIEPGTGKYQGKIGALICQDSSKKLKVSVGTGLTDADRELPKDYYLDKIVAVKYNAMIPNAKKDGTTLFLPRFVEVRIDKDVPDNA